MIDSLNGKSQLWHNVCRAIDSTAHYYNAEVGPRLANVFDVTDAVMEEVEHSADQANVKMLDHDLPPQTVAKDDWSHTTPVQSGCTLNTSKGQAVDKASESVLAQLRAESDIWHGIIPCCRAEAIIRKHYEGHLAVEGKPLELQTRDELLAYIKANETGDNFNAEPKLNVSCSNENIVKKLIALPTYGKITGTAFGTMICLEEAIAAMGTETAVNASKEQEEFGIAPEAAGLEPECDQPVPANMGEESIRKDEAPAMDALADGLSPSPAHSSGYPDNGLSLREKAMSVKSFFDSPKSYSDEEYAFVVENANLLWKHLGNAPNPVRSGEMRLLSEQERYESLKNLTQHLPDLPDNTTMPWIWSEEEIAMLRAACAKRFDESLRTESLFCIAMTGIRIFLSRAKPEPVMSEPVSLIKCAMALQGNQRIKLGSDLQAIAKAVLDASGVQYAD